MDDADFTAVVVHILGFEQAPDPNGPRAEPKRLSKFSRNVLRVVRGERVAKGRLEHVWSEAVTHELRRQRSI